MRIKTRIIACAAAALFAFAGCSSDDDGGSAAPEPTATATEIPPATATPEPTAAATPTATREHHGHEHIEMPIGSTEDGGGELAADFDFDLAVPVFFDTCLGGSGDECSGGVRLYSTSNLGITALGHDHDDDYDDDHEHGAGEQAGQIRRAHSDGESGHHDENGNHHDDENGHGHGEELFPLEHGTVVSLEVLAIDAGLSMRIEGMMVSTAGQTVELGEAPHFHTHPETFISLEDGQEESEFQMSFRLTTDAPEYEPSDELTLRFVPVGDGHHDDDGDHGHGH